MFSAFGDVSSINVEDDGYAAAVIVCLHLFHGVLIRLAFVRYTTKDAAQLAIEETNEAFVAGGQTCAVLYANTPLCSCY